MTFLEGNEVEHVYDAGAGKLIVDVTDKGAVKLANEYVKNIYGVADVKSITEVNSNIFRLLKLITTKTKTEWDDKALSGLMGLLGISDPDVIALAQSELIG